MPVNDYIILRKGSSTEWNTADPILSSGEPGFDITNNILKIGDGTTIWSLLSPMSSSDIYVYAKNTTGGSLTKGQAVYISGAQGDHPVLALASAAMESSSSKTLGLLKQNLNDNEFGYVVTEGVLAGLDTDSAGSAGDTVWLSPTTPGGLVYGLANKPYAPNHMVFIGYVLRKNLNNGSIYIKVQNGYELEELHNVAVTGVSNGQFLQYNSSSGLWVGSSSGNFSTLSVNGTGVSLSGHTHTTSQITDFNSSVSGLLPTIANSGDNRVLTSTGSTVGINAEPNLTFDGTNLSAPYLLATYSSGDEGGEIQLAKPPNGTLSGGVTIDAYQNKLRFFEQGGTARGFYLDLSSGGAAASTNLAAGGGSATNVSNYADNRIITSDGTSTGLNAESNLTFDGTSLAVNGLVTATSGNFTSNLQFNGTGVSISGHTHISSDITNFNSSVSGLLPVKNIVAGSNVSITSNSGVFTINSSGVGGSGSTSVYEYTSTSGFPASGVGSTIYISTNSGKIYRWDSSNVYVEIGPVGSLWSWTSAPTASTSNGTAGNVAYDSNYFYVCTSGDVWKAASLARWDGDPYWSNTTFLMRFDGTNGSTTFTDLSLTGATATASSTASVSTAQAKFGQSLALNGSSDFITLGNYGSAFTFDGDYTVEAWVYITSASTYHPILEGRTAAAFANYTFGVYNLGGTLRLDHVTSVDRLTGSSTSVSLNTWTHIAWVRKSGVIRCYVNGTRDSSSYTNSNTLTPLGTVLIGKVVDPQYFAGYIDEIRVTKAARYDSSTITVPTTQFPAFSN